MRLNLVESCIRYLQTLFEEKIRSATTTQIQVEEMLIPVRDCEFVDGEFRADVEEPYRIRIRWPEGYAEKYIQGSNVMPTKRFFDFVCWKSNQLIRSISIQSRNLD